MKRTEENKGISVGLLAVYAIGALLIALNLKNYFLQ